MPERKHYFSGAVVLPLQLFVMKTSKIQKHIEALMLTSAGCAAIPPIEYKILRTPIQLAVSLSATPPHLMFTPH